MNAIRQLLRHLEAGNSLTGDDAIALLLLLTMLVSTVHLLTLTATRWGERHVALKSLCASILIHGVCFLGLEVFEPLRTFDRPDPAPAPIRPEEQLQAELLVESDETQLLPESGNTTLADRPVQPDVPLKRFEFASPVLPDEPISEPESEIAESLSVNPADVTQFIEQKVPETAAPADSGVAGLPQPAVEDPDTELKTMAESSAMRIPLRDRVRTIPRPGELEPSVQPEPVPPALSEASAPKLDVDQMTLPESPDLPSPNPESVSIPLEPGSDSSDVISRAAPQLSAEAAEGTAVGINKPGKQSVPAQSFQPRLRRSARSMPDDKPAPLPSRKVYQTPQTPVPLSQSYDDVRIGAATNELSESIATGAALMDADLPEIRRRVSPPSTYLLRNVEKRRDAVRKFGGTRESEDAVERSLSWLSRNQSSDGRWDAEDFGAGQVKIDENGVDRRFAGREADTGVTALCTLAFLGAGYTHENGRYSFAVDHGLDWMIRQQAADGNLSGKAEHFARMYCHAMATYALAEAYGMQRESLLGPLIDPAVVRELNTTVSSVSAAMTSAVFAQPLLAVMQTPADLNARTADQIAYSLRMVDDLRLRNALAKAVTYTLSQQDPRSGGWRYRLGQEGDVSMFGWQMMSLKSAEIAGVEVDSSVRKKMDAFLNSVRQGEQGGLFGYRRNIKSGGRDSEPPTPVMTAEALFCQQMLGYPRDTPSTQESVEYLLRHPPIMSELNYYYWYYGTLAMYQFGGESWQKWNSVVRDSLISQQRTDGSLDGSWDPSDPWGRYGGRLYSTALATLTLEVYYRLLPLYRMNAPDESPAPRP
jgi:hypothetical protein